MFGNELFQILCLLTQGYLTHSYIAFNVTYIILFALSRQNSKLLLQSQLVDAKTKKT